ncbi:MAG: sensor domain-containing diguanylate cyclase, partial [Comamonadaceae bacterium]
MVRLARMFVVFVCIVILAANAWIVMAARSQELRQSRVASENLARAVAQQMDAIFGETEHVLESLAFELDNRDLGNDTLQDLQPKLVHQVAQLSQLDGLFVLDAQGRWRTHSQSQVPAGADNTQREDFIHHRDSPSERVRIGAPMRSPTSGHWVIPVSRRLSDPYARFAGVVLATVSLEQLVSVMSTFKVGVRGAILLGRRDGTVLARWPLRDQDLGRSLAQTSAYRDLTGAQQGTFENTSPLDGEHRVVSFQHARDRPLYVTIALSRQELLQAWRLSATLQTAWAVLLCLIVGGAGAFMVLVVRRRSMAESALRQASEALQ